MSSTLNTVNLIGFVGTEPDIKNSNSGIVTHISIGVQEKFKNRDGTYTERTDWIKITSFGNTAKYVSQYINTGDLVVVEGKLKNNNYTDRNGKKHSEMYVQSNNISLLRKKGLSSEAPQAGYTTSSHTQKNQQQQYTPQPQFQQQQQNVVVSKNGRSYIQQTNLNRSNIQHHQSAPNRNNNNNYGYGNGAGYVQYSESPF